MIKKRITIVLLFLMLWGICQTGFASPYYNYSFTYFGNEAAEPQAYIAQKTIDGATMGTTHMKSPTDIFTATVNGETYIYIVDTGNNRILAMDRDFKLVHEIDSYEITTTKLNFFSKWPSLYKEAFSEEFPTPTPTPTPTATPEVTEEATADPEATPETTPETDPEATPEATPEVTPEATPEATPEGEGSVTAEPQLSAVDGDPEATADPEATEGAEETAAPTPTPVADIPNPDQIGTWRVTFKQPQGVFVESNGNMYICDTENNQIVYLKYEDGQYTTAGIYDDPQVKMVDSGFVYRPTKIVKDNSGRLYVLAKNNTNGILQLDSNGVFVTYVGANKTAATAIQILVRTFMPWLIEQTVAVVPTEYSNITIDEEGFIYGTIRTVVRSDLFSHMNAKDAGKGAPVRRLNANGNDILRRFGSTAPVGDILALTSYAYLAPETSQFVDVAVDEDNNYTVLDYNRGRAFTYDYDGNLLFVFGGIGSVQGTFVAQGAESIAILDNENYLILDNKQNLIVYYTPTTQGRIIKEALKAKMDRDYEKATEKWEEYLTFSSNSEVAYNNIGKLYLKEGRDLFLNDDTRQKGAEYFKKAMDAFRLAEERTNYSEAYTEYRRYEMEKVLPFALTAIIILGVLAVVMSYVNKYRQAKLAKEIERRARKWEQK